MKFSKAKMLARLEREGLIDQVDEEIEEILNKLDGKEVNTYCWNNVVYDMNEGICEGYPVNLDDCEI